MDLRNKKLTRSRTSRLVAGVIGGIAEYLSIDVIALRVAWIVLVIFTGVVPGVIAYIFMMLIMPEEGDVKVHDVTPEEGK